MKHLISVDLNAYDIWEYKDIADKLFGLPFWNLTWK